MLSTGWNTSQGESIHNYAEWIDGITRAALLAKFEFRPLVVGFTWQSTWDNLPSGSSVSVLNKGNDADEIGAGWVNMTMHQAVLPVAKELGIPVVLVGHSYGTRVLGHSVFLPGLVPHEPVSSPDAFIAFQAAFPIARLVDSGREPYWTGSTDTRVVITSSMNDTANGMVSNAGGAKGLALAASDKYLKQRILLRAGDATGRIETFPKSGELVLADLSATVNCIKPTTGGGAHSDVFDSEAANLVLQAIQSIERVNK